jgi:hypothetical protein
MTATNTEIHLASWRFGSTEAERLAAAILHLEGYKNIEPQAPLGGPDGKKDILCDRGRRLWLGAVYFPPLTKNFQEIKEKFKFDLNGAVEHNREGIVFITNQRLKISERSHLKEIALEQKKECEVYDIERIRGILDVPTGYGVRVAFLRIPMGIDEQLAFFARRENVIESAVERNTEELKRLAAQITSLQVGQRAVAETMAVISNSSVEMPPIRLVDPLAMGDIYVPHKATPVSLNFTPELIMYVHRLVGFELPSRMIGVYRDQSVYVGMAGTSLTEAVHLPPPASKVPELLKALCDNWCKTFSTLQSEKDKVQALANFHYKFLSLHPFLDGNGRVARALLMQQSLDLFGSVNMSRFDRGVLYNQALAAANKGDLTPLEGLIQLICEY